MSVYSILGFARNDFQMRSSIVSAATLYPPGDDDRDRGVKHDRKPLTVLFAVRPSVMVSTPSVKRAGTWEVGYGEGVGGGMAMRRGK